MAHYATKRYNYWSQLGILTALLGAGLIIGGMAQMIPFVGKIDFSSMFNGTFAEKLDALMTPANSAVFRWSQVIGTWMVFCLPVILYARVCHVKSRLHLGLSQPVNWKAAALTVAIMTASLPAAAALEELRAMLPWSKAMLAEFDRAENNYIKQVAVMARMNDFSDYLVSLLVMAVFPGIVEEVLFRGGFQNLLTRWFKRPALAVIVASIIFSAVHLSYLGFLTRFLLGFILGWIYYRTGNLWLCIIGHFFNNALTVTAIYLTSKPGEQITAAKMNDDLPLWTGLLSIAAVVGLCILFEKLIKKDIDRPGKELLIPGYSSNPFDNDIALQQSNNQQ
jgi:uncharacterized protein